MKTKKLKKRSFVGAIALLVISAITLTTSTFAWFSMGQDAKIETMDLTVSSPEGFEISANAENWTSTLTPTEIFSIASGADNYSLDNYQDSLAVSSPNTNYLPVLLKPVSCAFENDADFFSAAYASRMTEEIKQDVASEYITETIDGVTFVHDPTADEVGFVAFDLYIKSGYKDGTKLYFDKSEFVEKEGGSNLNATTALRVAFANYGCTGNIDSDAATSKALSSFKGVTVFEPDPAKRSDGSAGSVLETKYVVAAGTGLSVDDENKVFTSSVAPFADNGTTKRLVQNQKDTDGKTTNGDEQYITVDKGVNKFRVFIWIEGNDIDCLDRIGSDQLSATFRFQEDRTAEFSLDDYDTRS